MEDRAGRPRLTPRWNSCGSGVSSAGVGEPGGGGASGPPCGCRDGQRRPGRVPTDTGRGDQHRQEEVDRSVTTRARAADGDPGSGRDVRSPRVQEPGSCVGLLDASPAGKAARRWCGPAAARHAPDAHGGALPVRTGLVTPHRLRHRRLQMHRESGRRPRRPTPRQSERRRQAAVRERRLHRPTPRVRPVGLDVASVGQVEGHEADRPPTCPAPEHQLAARSRSAGSWFSPALLRSGRRRPRSARACGSRIPRCPRRRVRARSRSA